MKSGKGDAEMRIMWEPTGDASESAMIKFGQEQPLFDKMAYVEAGNKQENPKLVDPDSKVAPTARCAPGSLPGINVARLAYSKIDCTVNNTTKTWEIQFNSKNKYSLSVHKLPGDTDAALLLMKGAPERILSRCDHVWHEGERIPLTDELRNEYESLNSKLAAMGRRCLAFCEQELDATKYPASWTGFELQPVNYPIGNDETETADKIATAKKEGLPEDNWENMESCGKLTYIGLAALIDPPRKQVPKAVEKCKSAGIKVVMVTGDHPETAHAIAKEGNFLFSLVTSHVLNTRQNNTQAGGVNLC